MDISVSLAAGGQPLRPALDWAADSKISHVEIDGRRQVKARELGATARRQIRHLIGERSMRASGLLFPLKGGIADIDRLSDRVDLACDTMQLARDLGASALIVPFRVPSDEVDRERTSEVLANLARHADVVGCRLLLRTGGDSAEVRDLIKTASSAAPIGVQFDPASSLLSNESLEASVQTLGEMIEQLRIIDAMRSSGSLGRETAVGRGEVDFDLLAALIDQLGTKTAVVSPDDAKVAPLADAYAFTRAVFDPFAR